MDLQELVARARILFKDAPKRVAVFERVNGKRSAKEIAKITGRGLSATLADLQKMKDMGLVSVRRDSADRVMKKGDSVVYEKDPILKHLSKVYFEQPTSMPRRKMPVSRKQEANLREIHVPTEQEILDICRDGESQLYEFKSAGTEAKKLSREICAFANTRMGGIVFYGVEDDGVIGNADMKRQVFDQMIQNSIHNMISPAIAIKVIEKDVLGHKIYLLVVPPWNASDVYQFDGRVLMRKGTNVLQAKPEESKKLHSGKFVY